MARKKSGLMMTPNTYTFSTNENQKQNFRKAGSKFNVDYYRFMII